MIYKTENLAGKCSQDKTEVYAGLKNCCKDVAKEERNHSDQVLEIFLLFIAIRKGVACKTLM